MIDTKSVEIEETTGPELGIRAKHGPLVATLWWTTKAATILSIQFNWLRLSRFRLFEPSAYDSRVMKSKPWWQDLGLLWWLALGIVAIALMQDSRSCAVCAGGIIASYVVIDMILYHVRVLWFDGIRPAIRGGGKEVWSNTRLLFVSLLAYAGTILLFPAIYRAFGDPARTASENLLRLSFKTATTFDLSESLWNVSSIQIVVSLFFLAVVIATMASMSYERPEIASSDE